MKLHANFSTYRSLVIAAALGLATLLVGCGGGEPTATATPERAPLTWDKTQASWDTATWQ